MLRLIIVVTNYFVDGVRRWDINRLGSHEQGTEDNLIFGTQEAIRLRISSDSFTMVVRTQW